MKYWIWPCVILIKHIFYANSHYHIASAYLISWGLFGTYVVLINLHIILYYITHTHIYTQFTQKIMKIWNEIHLYLLFLNTIWSENTIMMQFTMLKFIMNHYQTMIFSTLTGIIYANFYTTYHITRYSMNMQGCTLSTKHLTSDSSTQRLKH